MLALVPWMSAQTLTLERLDVFVLAFKFVVLALIPSMSATIILCTAWTAIRMGRGALLVKLVATAGHYHSYGGFCESLPFTWGVITIRVGRST
jgi:hypothetical protein